MRGCTLRSGGKFRSSRRNRQHGQAMVFASVTMVIVLLSLLVMYNAGQITTQKMKLQNTADAVAYSAALVQARDLNFSSYMNRAMIANQVAVGQVVSLTGWIRNFDDTYNGGYSAIATTIASLSSMSWMWNTPSKVLGNVAKQAKSFMDAAGPVTVKALDFLIDALRLASVGYHYGTVVTIAETVSDVMTANDPQASVSPVGIVEAAASVGQHVLFTKSFDPTAASKQDGEDRFAKVVDASSDLFYKNRTLPLPLRITPSLIDPTRLFTPGAGPLLMLQFHSGGSTMRSSDMKSYASADATGLFVIFCITIPIFGIPVPIPFPLPPLPSGAGAAAAGTFQNTVLSEVGTGFVGHRNGDNDGVDGWAAVDYGAAYFNPMTAIPYWIKAAQGPGSNMDSRAGLRPYLDVKNNITGTQGNQATSAMTGTNYHNDKAPAFRIEIERESGSIATSDSPTFRIGGGRGGQLDLEDKSAANKMRASSKAEAYFSRPTDLFARGDGKKEYGSLYSPYWQVHLQPSSILEQGVGVLSQMAGL